MRTSIFKTITTPETFKLQCLSWANQFREVIFLDSNTLHANTTQYSTYDMVLAVDAFTLIKTDYCNAFDSLKQYQQTSKDWLFGYLSYDLKNDTEALVSNNLDTLDFADLFFFQPKKLFLLKNNLLEIKYLKLCQDEMDTDFKAITQQACPSTKKITTNAITIQQRILKNQYVSKVNQILHHINRGDIYEANFCMEFFAENVVFNPLQKFNNLNDISKAPFSVFFKNNAHYLLSASPERYLKKQDNLVISQPIKGTAKRYEVLAQDLESKQNLAASTKERSENIMIVDLVRNDLSRIANKGSVQVTELCKTYSFKQVHQMISTIQATVLPNLSPVTILQNTFPMGSMTGAPKIAAMKIIEQLELSKRGLYSGSVGYFTPNGDFDFNVVIRSILYNAHKKYVSFSVGSAITALSDPEQEYAECLLKAQAMRNVLLN